MNTKGNVYALSISPHSTHQLLLNLIGKDRTVLDVGCNDGYLGKLADTSNTFYGLDYLHESIKKTKKTYKDAAVYDLNDLKPLPWNMQFDTIIFADVLEHLVDPEQALRFFVDRYLKKSGRVIISVPNVANWQIRLKLLSGKFDYTESGIMDHTHLHLYTHKTAKELAQSADLAVKKTYGGATFFGPVIKFLPLSKTVLASSIIIEAKKHEDI